MGEEKGKKGKLWPGKSDVQSEHKKPRRDNRILSLTCMGVFLEQ